MVSSRIEILKEKKLAGKHLNMTLADNKTSVLWQSFMQARKAIKNAIGSDLYSMQIYPLNYFNNFDLNNEFVKWAAVEVTDFDSVAEGMETYLLPSGLYAVFTHIGAADTGSKTFRYILETWLPNSEYVLDDRPYFEILGDKYKNDDPLSEEEIWIPIRVKE